MLNSTNNMLLHWHAVSATVMASASVVNISKLRVVLIRAAFDAVLVAVIAGASTLMALGYSNLDLNLEVALISGGVSGLLSFCTEIRKNEPEILNCKEQE
jgi:hypothetical protein